MSRAIDRHRARQASHGVEKDIMGDGEASNYGNLIATLANAGAEIADKEKTRQNAEKKANDDKAAQKKREGDIQTMEDKLASLQSTADSATADVEIKNAHAQQEKESYGPLHTAAIQARQKADAANKAVFDLQMKIAALKAGSNDPNAVQQQLLQLQDQARRNKSAVPTWVWYGGGAVAAVGVVALVVKLMRRK